MGFEIFESPRLVKSSCREDKGCHGIDLGEKGVERVVFGRYTVSLLYWPFKNCIQ